MYGHAKYFPSSSVLFATITTVGRLALGDMSIEV